MSIFNSPSPFCQQNIEDLARRAKSLKKTSPPEEIQQLWNKIDELFKKISAFIPVNESDLGVIVAQQEAVEKIKLALETIKISNALYSDIDGNRLPVWLLECDVFHEMQNSSARDLERELIHSKGQQLLADLYNLQKSGLFDHNDSLFQLIDQIEKEIKTLSPKPSILSVAQKSRKKSVKFDFGDQKEIRSKIIHAMQAMVEHALNLTGITDETNTHLEEKLPTEEYQELLLLKDKDYHSVKNSKEICRDLDRVVELISNGLNKDQSDTEALQHYQEVMQEHYNTLRFLSDHLQDIS